MPGMIMENICSAKGITNGTLCTVHTLLFNMEKGTPEEIILKNSAKTLIEAAQIITGYTTVNINIHPDYMGVGLSTSVYTPQQWPRDQTLLEHHIIVPIPFAITKTKVEVAMKEGLLREIPFILQVRNMAVQPGFGATPDKYQGKTAIPLVARIGLNPRRNLTLPMLLVIVSRVTKGSDLGDKNEVNQRCFGYLDKRFACMKDIMAHIFDASLIYLKRVQSYQVASSLLLHEATTFYTIKLYRSRFYTSLHSTVISFDFQNRTTTQQIS